MPSQFDRLMNHHGISHHSRNTVSFSYAVRQIQNHQAAGNTLAASPQVLIDGNKVEFDYSRKMKFKHFVKLDKTYPNLQIGFNRTESTYDEKCYRCLFECFSFPSPRFTTVPTLHQVIDEFLPYLHQMNFKTTELVPRFSLNGKTIHFHCSSAKGSFQTVDDLLDLLFESIEGPNYLVDGQELEEDQTVTGIDEDQIKPTEEETRISSKKRKTESINLDGQFIFKAEQYKTENNSIKNSTPFSQVKYDFFENHPGYDHKELFNILCVFPHYWDLRRESFTSPIHMITLANILPEEMRIKHLKKLYDFYRIHKDLKLNHLISMMNQEDCQLEEMAKVRLMQKFRKSKKDPNEVSAGEIGTTSESQLQNMSFEAVDPSSLQKDLTKSMMIALSSFATHRSISTLAESNVQSKKVSESISASLDFSGSSLVKKPVAGLLFPSTGNPSLNLKQSAEKSSLRIPSNWMSLVNKPINIVSSATSNVVQASDQKTVTASLTGNGALSLEMMKVFSNASRTTGGSSSLSLNESKFRSKPLSEVEEKLGFSIVEEGLGQKVTTQIDNKAFDLTARDKPMIDLKKLCSAFSQSLKSFNIDGMTVSNVSTPPRKQEPVAAPISAHEVHLGDKNSGSTSIGLGQEGADPYEFYEGIGALFKAESEVKSFLEYEDEEDSVLRLSASNVPSELHRKLDFEENISKKPLKFGELPDDFEEPEGELEALLKRKMIDPLDEDTESVDRMSAVSKSIYSESIKAFSNFKLPEDVVSMAKSFVKIYKDGKVYYEEQKIDETNQNEFTSGQSSLSSAYFSPSEEKPVELVKLIEPLVEPVKSAQSSVKISLSPGEEFENYQPAPGVTFKTVSDMYLKHGFDSTDEPDDVNVPQESGLISDFYLPTETVSIEKSRPKADSDFDTPVKAQSDTGKDKTEGRSPGLGLAVQSEPMTVWTAPALAGKLRSASQLIATAPVMKSTRTSQSSSSSVVSRHSTFSAAEKVIRNEKKEVLLPETDLYVDEDVYRLVQRRSKSYLPFESYKYDCYASSLYNALKVLKINCPRYFTDGEQYDSHEYWRILFIEQKLSEFTVLHVAVDRCLHCSTYTSNVHVQNSRDIDQGGDETIEKKCISCFRVTKENLKHARKHYYLYSEFCYFYSSDRKQRLKAGENINVAITCPGRLISGINFVRDKVDEDKGHYEVGIANYGAIVQMKGKLSWKFFDGFIPEKKLDPRRIAQDVGLDLLRINEKFAREYVRL